MDGDRFDELTRALGSLRTRRGALRAAVAGAVLAAAAVVAPGSLAKNRAAGDAGGPGSEGGKGGKGGRNEGSGKNGKGKNKDKNRKNAGRREPDANRKPNGGSPGTGPTVEPICPANKLAYCHCVPTNKATSCQIQCSSGDAGHSGHPFDCTCFDDPNNPLPRCTYCGEADNSACCPNCGAAGSPGPNCCIANGAGFCTNFQTDPANCGACGTVCAAGETCCSGVCRNLQTDPKNCGTCGKACPTGDICVLGSCTAGCVPTTCASLGSECGTPDDNCGNKLNCGTCPNGLTCSNDTTCVCGAGTLCGAGANRVCCTGATPYCGAGGVCVACQNDAQCDDKDVCTADTCDVAKGVCVHTNIPCEPKICEILDGCDPNDGCQYHDAPAGDPCDGGLCDGAGNCVECVSAAQCDDKNVCTADTCDVAKGVCVHTKIPCEPKICKILDGCDPKDGCQYHNAPAGDPCDGGLCDGAGNCVQCLVNADCQQPGTPCREAVCTDQRLCVTYDRDGVACSEGGKDGCCDKGACGIGQNVCKSSGICISACGAGQTWDPDTCECLCTETSCPNGCCKGAVCVPYIQQDNETCGKGGAACAPCQDPTGNCNDSGVCVACDEDSDCGTDTTCRAYFCNPDGTCSSKDAPLNTDCTLATGGPGFCDGAGSCVPCNDASQCGVSDACLTWTCTANVCGSIQNDGEICGPTQEGCCQGGSCQEELKVCKGVCIADDACCVDSDCGTDTDCASYTCNANHSCTTNFEIAGTSCDEKGGKVCDGKGICVPCVKPDDCGMSDACITWTCEANTCGSFNTDGVICGAKDEGCCLGGTCRDELKVCAGICIPDGDCCGPQDCTTAPNCFTNEDAACTAGQCVYQPVTCPKPPVCRINNICDPATGLCASSPDASQNGNVCGTDSVCCDGACIVAECCTASDCDTPPLCRTATGATCDNGACTYPAIASDQRCEAGCCSAGTCTPYTGQNAALCGTGGAACASCDDQNSCTTDTCSPQGVCQHAPITGDSCGDVGCCDNGTCDLTLNACPAQGICIDACADGQIYDPETCACTCTADSCPDGCCTANETCVPFTAQTAALCGTGGETCATCADGDVCTTDVCTQGVCSNPAVPVGDPCTDQSGVCNGDGVCVQCIADTDCATGQACCATSSTCVSTTCPAGQVYDPTTCACSAGLCIELGGACSGSGQGTCCTGLACSGGICVSTTCAAENKPCTEGLVNCCTGLTCTNGICKTPPAICAQTGEDCTKIECCKSGDTCGRNTKGDLICQKAVPVQPCSHAGERPNGNGKCCERLHLEQGRCVINRWDHCDPRKRGKASFCERGTRCAGGRISPHGTPVCVPGKKRRGRGSERTMTS
ncbi:MAG: hypothetical protein ACKOWF_19600 [Chloroflexota bacterium]